VLDVILRNEEYLGTNCELNGVKIVNFEKKFKGGLFINYVHKKYVI